MKTYTVNKSQIFEMQECISCGCAFMIPNILGIQLRENKNSFYCPNGHKQAYVESEADRLKRQLANKEAELSQALMKLTLATTPPTKRKARRTA